MILRAHLARAFSRARAFSSNFREVRTRASVSARVISSLDHASDTLVPRSASSFRSLELTLARIFGFIFLGDEDRVKKPNFVFKGRESGRMLLEGLSKKRNVIFCYKKKKKEKT